MAPLQAVPYGLSITYTQLPPEIFLTTSTDVSPTLTSLPSGPLPAILQSATQNPTSKGPSRFHLKKVVPLVRVDISVDVKNFGRTPARITDLLLSTMIIGRNLPLPPDPIYTSPINRVLPSAFLVSNDSFNVSSSLLILGDVQFNNITMGELQLFVVGYVDYVDQFRERHRSGYGRRYAHDADGNNLVFIDARGYNYDRVRLPGEGNDWNEPA